MSEQKITTPCRELSRYDAAELKQRERGRAAEANSTKQLAYFHAACVVAGLAREHFSICAVCQAHEELVIVAVAA